MIFNIPRTIEFLSSFTTLRPGDVIATGTPGGVGFARQPPEFDHVKFPYFFRLVPPDQMLVVAPKRERDLVTS